MQYGRQLTVDADGTKKAYWTTADSVNEALADLGLRYDTGAVFSTSRSAPLGREGLELVVKHPEDRPDRAPGQGRDDQVDGCDRRRGADRGQDRLGPGRPDQPGGGHRAQAGRQPDRVREGRRQEGHQDRGDRPRHRPRPSRPRWKWAPRRPPTKGINGAKSVTYVLTYLDGKLTTTKLLTVEAGHRAGRRAGPGRHQAEAEAPTPTPRRHQHAAVHRRHRVPGTGSPSASRAATGRSTPATGTTAACSSTTAPGRPTAGRRTPPTPTARPRRSRSRSRRRSRPTAVATAPGRSAASGPSARLTG